jgi:hypothetical protein
MILVRRTGGQGHDMTAQQRSIRRLPGWLRIVAAVVTVAYCLLLIPDHELRDVLKTAVLGPFFLLIAIAPQGLFDGRSAAWIGRHPILTGGIMFVFFGTLCLTGLSAVLDWLPALAITVPVTAIVVAVGTFFDRRARSAASSPGDS